VLHWECSCSGLSNLSKRRLRRAGLPIRRITVRSQRWHGAKPAANRTWQRGEALFRNAANLANIGQACLVGQDAPDDPKPVSGCKIHFFVESPPIAIAPA
jgi:hypothetical protein